MMMNVICYKTKDPIVYNKGTKWERSHDTFLYKYVYGNETDTQNLVNELNEMLKDGVTTHDGLDMTKIAKFYPSKQEEMY